MAQERKSAAGSGLTSSMFTNALPDMEKLMMAGPHMQAAMMKVAIDQQRELFAFCERRCNEDMKLADQISAAKSVGELYTACLDFYRDAATQYAAEASKAAEIGSQGTIGVLYDLQQQRDEAMSAIKEPAAA